MPIEDHRYQDRESLLLLELLEVPLAHLMANFHHSVNRRNHLYQPLHQNQNSARAIQTLTIMLQHTCFLILQVTVITAPILISQLLQALYLVSRESVLYDNSPFQTQLTVIHRHILQFQEHHHH